METATNAGWARRAMGQWCQRLLVSRPKLVALLCATSIAGLTVSVLATPASADTGPTTIHGVTFGTITNTGYYNERFYAYATDQTIADLAASGVASAFCGYITDGIGIRFCDFVAKRLVNHWIANDQLLKYQGHTIFFWYHPNPYVYSSKTWNISAG
jgi:hypothetical protein